MSCKRRGVLDSESPSKRQHVEVKEQHRQVESLNEEGRADCTVHKVHINSLPDDVLIRIFKHLPGPSLARAEGVCRTWRREIRESRKGVELWRNLCEKYKIDENLRESDKSKLGHTRKRVEKAESSSKQHASVLRRMALLWRRLYINYRRYICQCCLAFGKRLKQPLYGNVQLCNECKFKEPYAALTTTQARKYFGFQDRGPHNLVRGNCIGGWLYRFDQVYSWAADRVGEDRTEKMANKARRELGIGRMEKNQLPLTEV